MGIPAAHDGEHVKTVAEPVATADEPRSGRRWQPWALTAICGIAALLYLWGIGSSWGNTYYTAAVKSMSHSFENFLFGSLDAAGVVTVDKPPMALWAQVLSVKMFGFNQFAVLFPQALFGVAAVFLLHRTVRRWAGEHAGLLAALVLALTPITVMINRDNNPDTLLVLLVVAAAYAMTRAFSGHRSTGWLALAAFLVGCGFLTKMLQSWMVLPAFVAAYLVGSRTSWGRKVVDLAVAAVVLLVSSFWWVAATALWPEPKPYIGGSDDGSAWNLVFGYNGFGRIFGGSGPGAGGGPGGGGPGGGGGFSGRPGVLRMFNDQLAGQISWLLPLCGLVLVAMLVAGIRHRRAGRAADREHLAGWVVWGGWLVVVGIVLSFAQGTMHPYYTTMMAPAIGALVGAGTVRFWRWYRGPSRTAWLLLPAGVAITVAWAVAIVARNPHWHAWTGYLAAGLGVLALVLLVIGRQGRARLARTGLALALVAMLTVPTAWSAIGAISSPGMMGGVNPMAGPSTGMGPGGGPPGPRGLPDDRRGPRSPIGDGHRSDQRGQPGPIGRMPGGADSGLTEQQRDLLTYVRAHAADRTIPLAVAGGAMAATSYIINSDLTVVAMGGFTGGDNAPSVPQLAAWKESGQLGFVLLGGGIRGGPPPGAQAQSGGAAGTQPPGGAASGMAPMGGSARTERQQWVKQNCTPVDPAAWGGSVEGSQQLYTCT